MRTLLAFLALCLPQEKSRCDLKKTEKASWCEGCNRILEADTKMGNGDCRNCRKKPTQATVCVKEYWQCPRCKKSKRKEFACDTVTCKELGPAVAKKISKSRLLYACGGDCNTRKNEKFECKTKTCKSFGSNSIQICEFSGTFPHSQD